MSYVLDFRLKSMGIHFFFFHFPLSFAQALEIEKYKYFLNQQNAVGY